MKQPRIKEVHGVFYLSDRVRIGTGLDYAIEIADPEAKYAPLIRMLNGINTIDEIVQGLAPLLSEQEVQEGIQLLADEGYLEDATVTHSPLLSDQEATRYRVNLNFFNTLCKGTETKFEYQARLKQSHVVLFGIGGIGSNICLALAELGVGKITAIDFDRVELHNLNRQILYTTSAVGELKTEIAKKRISDFNSDIEFVTINHRIQSLEDVRSLLNQNPCDVVIDAADRPTGYIDFWVNEACVERGTPYFAASVAKKYGRVYSVIPGESACYQCHVLQEAEAEPTILEELEFIRETNFWTPNGALGPACMFHAYFISYEVMRYLLKLGPLLTFNRMLNIDFMTFEQEFIPIEKQKHCPVCGQGGAVDEPSVASRELA